jgi:GT2 family glycosyltransferase
LESLKKYDKKYFDVIVVENKSNDDYEIIKKYGDENQIYSYLADKNLWFAWGNNLWVNVCQKLSGNIYEFVLLLNPDTVLDQQDFFEKLYTESKRVNADIIGPKITEYPDTSKLYFAGGWLNSITLFPSKRGKGERDIEHI